MAIMDYHGLHIIDYYGLLLTVMDYYGLLRTIMDYHGLSWIITDCHRLSRTIKDYHRLTQTNTDYHGLSWSIMDYHGLFDFIERLFLQPDFLWTYKGTCKVAIATEKDVFSKLSCSLYQSDLIHRKYQYAMQYR